jgi:hypothetical protein
LKCLTYIESIREGGGKVFFLERGKNYSSIGYILTAVGCCSCGVLEYGVHNDVNI